MIRTTLTVLFVLLASGYSLLVTALYIRLLKRIATDVGRFGLFLLEVLIGFAPPAFVLTETLNSRIGENVSSWGRVACIAVWLLPSMVYAFVKNKWPPEAS